MEWIVCLILLALLLRALDKWIGYYGTTRGLLYYLGVAHNDLLSVEKIKELRDAALQRSIREFFRKGD